MPETTTSPGLPRRPLILVGAILAVLVVAGVAMRIGEGSANVEPVAKPEGNPAYELTLDRFLAQVRGGEGVGLAGDPVVQPDGTRWWEDHQTSLTVDEAGRVTGYAAMLPKHADGADPLDEVGLLVEAARMRFFKNLRILDPTLDGNEVGGWLDANLDQKGSKRDFGATSMVVIDWQPSASKPGAGMATVFAVPTP
jgi:hypothetical protein